MRRFHGKNLKKWTRDMDSNKDKNNKQTYIIENEEDYEKEEKEEASEEIYTMKPIKTSTGSNRVGNEAFAIRTTANQFNFPNKLDSYQNPNPQGFPPGACWRCGSYAHRTYNCPEPVSATLAFL